MASWIKPIALVLAALPTALLLTACKVTFE